MYIIVQLGIILYYYLKSCMYVISVNVLVFTKISTVQCTTDNDCRYYKQALSEWELFYYHIIILPSRHQYLIITLLFKDTTNTIPSLPGISPVQKVF